MHFWGFPSSTCTTSYSYICTVTQRVFIVVGTEIEARSWLSISAIISYVRQQRLYRTYTYLLLQYQNSRAHSGTWSLYRRHHCTWQYSSIRTSKHNKLLAFSLRDCAVCSLIELLQHLVTHWYCTHTSAVRRVIKSSSALTDLWVRASVGHVRAPNSTIRAPVKYWVLGI